MFVYHSSKVNEFNIDDIYFHASFASLSKKKPASKYSIFHLHKSVQYERRH